MVFEVVKSILGAPEAYSEDCDSARTLDIASGPVIHLEFVSDGVGQHVVTMSFLAGSNIGGSLQPARSVSKGGISAREVDFTLGFDIIRIKFFKVDLDMAIVNEVEFTAYSSTPTL